MRTEDKPIEKNETTTASGDHRLEEKHPAFGQASFSRRQGNPGKLYGSNLDDHQTYITLEVRQSERIHDMSRDWFFPRDRLIEVDFSAAQFAELLTTMNVGSGVPCTIRYTKDLGVFPRIPREVQTESERIEESFKRKLEIRVQKLEENEKKISELLEKKSLTKKDKAELKNLVYQARRFFTDTAPFAVSSMVEAKEKVVTSAKAEIEAFMTNAITNAGLESIMPKGNPVEALPPYREVKDE